MISSILSPSSPPFPYLFTSPTLFWIPPDSLIPVKMKFSHVASVLALSTSVAAAPAAATLPLVESVRNMALPHLTFSISPDLTPFSPHRINFDV